MPKPTALSLGAQKIVALLAITVFVLGSFVVMQLGSRLVQVSAGLAALAAGVLARLLAAEVADDRSAQ